VPQSNRLYDGDNLDILRRYIKDESVDLVHLDPPFNSNRTYNVLFAEKDRSRAAAQIKAFEDTWQWDHGAVHAYREVVERGGAVSQAMRSFWLLLGDTNMTAARAAASLHRARRDQHTDRSRSVKGNLLATINVLTQRTHVTGRVAQRRGRPWPSMTLMQQKALWT
jgi:hypothetical protein